MHRQKTNYVSYEPRTVSSSKLIPKPTTDASPVGVTAWNLISLYTPQILRGWKDLTVHEFKNLSYEFPPWAHLHATQSADNRIRLAQYASWVEYYIAKVMFIAQTLQRSMRKFITVSFWIVLVYPQNTHFTFCATRKCLWKIITIVPRPLRLR